MSVFASDVDGDDHVRRANAVGGAEGGDNNFVVERPIQQANLIEEDDAAETERTFSDGGAELSEVGDQQSGEAAPLIGQGGAEPGGRGSANAAGAAARGAVELEHMCGRLGLGSHSPGMQAYQSPRGRGPDVSFMAPTPDNIKYGEQKERRPVGFTPNSSWAVRWMV